MKFILSLILFSLIASGQIISPENIRTYKQLRNYIMNPDAEYNNKANITDASGILTTQNIVKINGNYSFSIDGTSLSQVVKFTMYNLPEKFYSNSIECEFQYSSGTTGNYKVYVENSASTKVSPEINLPNNGLVYSKSPTIYLTSGSPTPFNPYRLVFETTVANASQIYIDDIQCGDSTSVSSATNISEPISAGTMTLVGVTTAPTKGTMSADTVSYKRLGDIAEITYTFYQSAVGSSTNGSGDYLISLPPGFVFDSSIPNFTSAVNLQTDLASKPSIITTVGTIATGGGLDGPVIAYKYSSNQFRLSLIDYFAASGNWSSSFGQLNGASTVSLRFTIYAKIQGWGSSQGAAAANQTDYGPTAYTPTFTGLGTVTVQNCTHERKATYLFVECTFTAGTTTATEMRVSFPTGLTSLSTLPTLSYAGGWTRISTGSESQEVYKEPSVSYFTFGVKSAGVSGLTKQNGNAIVGSNNVVSFKASVPIQGWAENQRAPSLVGSITSNSVSSLRMESAIVASTGVVNSELGGSDWINGNCSNSSSSYTCTFTSGIFSTTPNCQVSTLAAAQTNIRHQISSLSSANVIVMSRNVNNSTLADQDFVLTCIGTR